MTINKLINPLPEKEIIKKWDSEEVLVSVICCTYNQEKYIEDTNTHMTLPTTERV